jgi:hypothetical protein
LRAASGVKLKEIEPCRRLRVKEGIKKENKIRNNGMGTKHLFYLTLFFPPAGCGLVRNKKGWPTLLFSTDLIGFPQFVAKFSTESPV